jgi:phosphoglycolate phosphatase-like HAD superfamily hydrolase
MSAIHLSAAFRPRPIRHVFMDWDGTTSLTRGGWSELMVDVFAEALPHLPGETHDSIRALSRDELMKLNGRPSIHQMARLSELVRERRGDALSADDYQRDYQSRIGRVVHSRLDAVRRNPASAEALLVPGVRDFFRALNERGIPITLASGTPYGELIDEVRLLGLEHHFTAIIGPKGLDDRSFSKREVLHALLHEHTLEGQSVAAFGDGPVELIETQNVGGLAIAVATDESAPHRMDPWKRATLLAVGAHAVIPNYTPTTECLDAFFPRPDARGLF